LIVVAIGEDLSRIRCVANMFHYFNRVTARPVGCASNDRLLRSHTAKSISFLLNLSEKRTAYITY
jgi:hypothetical protein